MDQIIVEGVRCFYDWQVIPLRPVMLLVGGERVIISAPSAPLR